MRLAVLLVVVWTSVAFAEPTVTTRSGTCVTKAAANGPIVKARSPKRGILQVDIVGAGDWCHASWKTKQKDWSLELVALVPPTKSRCKACKLRLEIEGLAAGEWTVTLAGDSARVRVK